jgi:hypothetical protein
LTGKVLLDFMPCNKNYYCHKIYYKDYSTMTTTKYEMISVRLSKQDADLIRSYADKEGCSVSALIRSTMRRKILQEHQHTGDFQYSSPSPNFDKLSFDARELTLRPFDLAISTFLKLGLTIEQAETAFMLSQADVLNSDVLSLPPSEIKTKVNDFYKNRVEQLSSDYKAVFK